MSHALALSPAAPMPQVVLLALACIAAAVWLYYRSRTGAGGASRSLPLPLVALRCAALAAIAFLLLNPVLTLAARELERPPLLVLIDTSHSMSIADMHGRRRFDVARDAVAGSTVASLQKKFSCQLYGFSDNARRVDAAALAHTVKPNGDATRIGESLAGAVGAQPTGSSGGVLIISDGRGNGDLSPEESARESRERSYPVFTMCIGTSAHGQNASILNRQPQVYAAPYQTVPLTAELRSVGLDGQTAHVDLIENGAAIATKDYTLDDQRAVYASFPVQKAAEGNYRYTLAIRPIPGEVTTADNQAPAFLQVVKSKARVLLLEARPTWDAKFLLQALRSDPTITVDAIFKLTDEKYFALKESRDLSGGAPASVTEDASATIKPPSTAADLAQYDIVVIGKGYDDFFGPTGVSVLEDYVANHAGNVIFLRGKAEDGPGDALHQLEPMQWTSDQVNDIQMEVTQEGKDNPAFDFADHPDPEMVVQKLPSLLSATRVQGQKALSVVLARSSSGGDGDPAQQMALVAYQNYGQGKVVGIAGEGLWQWALLPPTMQDYSGCFNEFWTQMVRWLVNQSDFLPGEDVTLKTDRGSYTPGDTVNLLAFTRGAAKAALPPVEVTDPAGHDTHVFMSKAPSAQADFAGTYRAVKPGEYVATVTRGPGSAIRTPFSVYPSSDEDLITAADPAEMQAIARAGGGASITPNSLDTLPAKLKAARESLASSSEPETAWDRWWVLALILGALTTEWLLRRRRGMI